MNYQSTLHNIPEERISTLHTSTSCLRCRSGLTGSQGQHVVIRDCTSVRTWRWNIP